MKDQRTDKVQQHFNIYLDGRKCKILAYTLNNESEELLLKTKIKGQHFPKSGHTSVLIPVEDRSIHLTAAFIGMYSDPKIEHWHYTIVNK